MQSRMVCCVDVGASLLREASNNVLISTPTPQQRQLGMETGAPTASSKDCARCGPEGIGEGGQVGEKVSPCWQVRKCIRSRKGWTGEFEVMGSLGGVLPSLSWGTHPGVRMGWKRAAPQGVWGL